MSYKNVEKSREIRLWIGQVIMPTIAGGIFLWSNPNTRNWIKNKANNIKNKFHKKQRKNNIVILKDEESK